MAIRKCYFGICILTILCINLQNSYEATIPNQRVSNYPKNFRSKIDSIVTRTKPSRNVDTDVHHLPKQLKKNSEISKYDNVGSASSSSSDINRADYDDPNSDNIAEEAKILSFKNEGGRKSKSLYESDDGVSTMLVPLKPEDIGYPNIYESKPQRPIRPTTIGSYRPDVDISQSILLKPDDDDLGYSTMYESKPQRPIRPTTSSYRPDIDINQSKPTTIISSYKPSYVPTPSTSTTNILPTIPIFTITKPPPIIDFTDLGTFSPVTSFVQKPDDTDLDFQTNPSGTVVPILGDSVSRNLKTNGERSSNGRSFFGSRRTPIIGSTIPQRRIVGSGNLMANSGENIQDIEEINEDDERIIKDFMFSDIKCFRTKHKEYFGAIVHLKSGFHLPYIRDRPQDPMSTNDCLMERTDNPNSYHMKISDLRNCGVEQCGDRAMCLTMVFPRVPMLALADDEITTIKCTPQKSTMSEIRTISFAGDSLENRLSSSTVDGGGQDFAAEVGVFRQNPGTKNGLFVKRVNSGGVVQLGEPLQLRSVIRGGDGWTFSKLTDVKVWRMRDTFTHNVDSLNPKDASEVITLVDPNGCRNKDFKVISETHPLRDPRNDLVHHFNFKAFLFRGQRANEPLIVTAKVQACHEPNDCISVDCKKDSDLTRFKRSPKEITNSTSLVHDWNSQLALRVIDLKDHSSSSSISNEDDFNYYSADNNEGRSISTYSCTDKMVGLSIGSSVITLILCIIIFTLITFCQRSRLRQTMFDQLTTQSSLHSDNTSSTNIQNSNWILKRSVSSLCPDIIHKSNKHDKPHPINFTTVNKPLPSLPLPDEVRKHLVNNSDQNVAKFLQNISSQNTGAEYECIPEDENNNLKSNEFLTTTKKISTKSDDFYIVYCCNPEERNQKRSSSVPSSFRMKKKIPNEFNNNNDDDEIDINIEVTTEESDDSLQNGSGQQQNIQQQQNGNRRTVRSVKRCYQQNRHKGLQRQKMNHNGHGSFPTRIYGKKNFVVENGTRSCRDKRHVINNDYYHDEFSTTQQSSEDSAYSGSISSKLKGTNHHTFSNQKYYNTSSTTPVVYSTTPEIHLISTPEINSMEKKNILNKNWIDNKKTCTTTHFVTRNDTSTQIIIVPETNV